MSGSNCCCFLTCIQISQEAGKVVWYSHLLTEFPQFAVVHMVKGFSIVSEAEDVFLELIVAISPSSERAVPKCSWLPLHPLFMPPLVTCVHCIPCLLQSSHPSHLFSFPPWSPFWPSSPLHSSSYSHRWPHYQNEWTPCLLISPSLSEGIWQSDSCELHSQKLSASVSGTLTSPSVCPLSDHSCTAFSFTPLLLPSLNVHLPCSSAPSLFSLYADPRF